MKRTDILRKKVMMKKRNSFYSMGEENRGKIEEGIKTQGAWTQ